MITKDWREILPIHPAADLFPLMTPDELQTLADDIKANGLRTIPRTWFDKDEKEWLIDGRNRLDALQMLGYRFSRTPLNASGVVSTDQFRIYLPDSRMTLQVQQYRECATCGTFGRPLADPYSLAVSLNIHCRHLTREQRHELIEKLLKANPDRSDRATAKLVQADHKTVGAKREQLEQRGEIPHTDTRTDTTGRQQQSHKPKVADIPPAPQSASDPILDELAAKYKGAVAKAADAADTLPGAEAPVSDRPATCEFIPEEPVTERTNRIIEMLRECDAGEREHIALWIKLNWIGVPYIRKGVTAVTSDLPSA